MYYIDRDGARVLQSLWEDEDDPPYPLEWCLVQAHKRHDCVVSFPLDKNKTMIRHKARLVRGITWG